jgi:hypothetical protein
MKPIVSFLLGTILFLICANSEAGAEDILAEQISDKLSEHRCSGIAVEVISDSTEERPLICAAAKQAAGLFQQCGLANMPLIRVQVTTTPPPRLRR